MNLNGLTRRNLFYHRAANLAVLLGVAVGTAVLTGALLVGDSLRYSLTRLTEERLGWVEQALIGGRFLPQSAVDGIKADGVAPVLFLRGSATAGARTARKVQILGVDGRFWTKGQPGGEAGVVTINEALARELQIAVGDRIEVSLLKTSDVPRESPLGTRDGDATVGQATFPVERILPDEAFGAKFTLQPSLDTVRTLFVPLARLQSALQQPGKINAVLLRGADGATVAKEVHAKLTLADLGLTLTTPKDRADRLAKKPGRMANAIKKALPEDFTKADLETYYAREYPYANLESKSFLIEPEVQRAALAAARATDLTAAPTLVYLANTLSDGKTALPYVLLAGVDPGQAPLRRELPDDQILLVKWPESPLAGKKGDTIKLVFFPPEQHGEFTERTIELTCAGSVDLAGPLVDPELTPIFPGVTDVADASRWDPPFKFDRTRVKSGDLTDRYWKEYRATPRAYVNLTTAEKLFGSRFGTATSIRLTGRYDAKSLETFTKTLLANLPLEKLGVVVQSVKADGLQASGGAMNFAVLFLCFSFFLIAAALLLVGLLVRLNLERRAKELGVLATAGYRRSVLRRLLLSEGAVLAVLGSLLGLFVAVLYSRLLVQLMQLLWPGGMLESFLRPSWSWWSLVWGFLGSVAVSLLTIWWVVRGLAKVPPRLLIAGKTRDESDPASLTQPQGRWRWPTVVGCAVVGLLLLGVGFIVPGHEAQAGTFFGSGALFLTAGILLIALWLRAKNPTPLRPRGGLTQLGVRNLARNPGRSLLTVSLLASAAFLLVAVESFRRSADTGGHGPASPDGGFALVGESELPIVRDLNTDDARGELLDALQMAWQVRKEPNIPALRDEASLLLAKTTIVGLRAREGDDASCLNLYQPRKPRILGVPASLLKRGGFVIGGSEAKTDEQRKNPWLLLTERAATPVPAFGENNTVQWMLGSGLGGTLTTQDGRGNEVPLRIAGLLRDSVFQSSLLIGEEAFLKLYPEQEGYRFFLIACPPGSEDKVKTLLQTALAPRGLSIETSAERLNGYLAIENTYLSTFQALGGLGLILGSLGLAIVLLRNVWERLSELALLQALGYRHRSLLGLILIENTVLLVLGLLVGTGAALLSIAPQLFAHTASLPWRSLGLLLGAVTVVGFLATLAATWAALRTPLPPALRRE